MTSCLPDRMERGSRSKNAGGLRETLGSEEVEVDFYSDSRLARRWKRRRMSYGNLGINAVSDKAQKASMQKQTDINKYATAELIIIDSDSEKDQPSDDLEPNDDTDSRSVDYTDGNDVTDVFDPQYMRFLANLKKIGNSYMLEHASGNETTPIVLIYEKEDSSDGGVDVEVAETMKRYQRPKKIKTENALKSQTKRVEPETPKRILRSHTRKVNTANSDRILRSSSGRERSEIQHKVLTSNSQRKDNAKPQFNQAETSDLLEERYQLFLESLIDGQHSLSDQAEEDPVSHAGNGSSSKRHASKACNHWGKSDLVDENYLQYLELLKDGQVFECTPEGRKEVIDEDSDSNSDPGKEAKDPVNSENRCLSKRQHPEATNSAKHQFNHLGGKKVTVESDSDSELMILETNPDREPVASVIDLDGDDFTENHKGAKFRAELMEILQKPFDRQEYEKLWQDVNHRSPVQGHRRLRKMEKSYPCNTDGRSYIQMHSDLASVINQSPCDKRRGLNLLRGFFYWLRNVAHEGSFKPWLDSSCVSTLPASPLVNLKNKGIRCHMF